MLQSPGNFIRCLIDNIRRHPKVFRLYLVLRALVFLSLINSIIDGEFESAMVCVLVLVLFLVPSFMENRFKIEVPPLFEGIIYVFIYAAQILGEVNDFYTIIPGWDTVLHMINGFLAAAVGFSTVYLFNRHSKNVNLSPFYLAMVAFCFSLTVGVMWEFVETAGDTFFGQDMQKDYIIQEFSTVTLDPTNSQRLVHINDITETIIYTADGTTYTIDGGYLDIGRMDTMKDLFVNFIGALAFSALGYFYVKKKGMPEEEDEWLLSGLMLRTADEDENEETPGAGEASDSKETAGNRRHS